jgi:NAD(P)-dependent dehydrogenase (short-subunit alcohol dehydrogenase family)
MVGNGWGRVVFVSSESAVNTPKEMLEYGMTKTAQLAVSRGLAEAVAATGVTVNAVLPGPTRSEILGNYMAKQAEENGISIDEADACSEQASATSGAALRLDGGVMRFVA